MDDLVDKYQTEQIVTPFGQTGFIQQGVAITKLRGLRERFTKLADTSDLDMNPEHCIGYKLKRRIYGR